MLGARVSGARVTDSEADLELARARLRVGTTLRGKYRLDSVLGVGGMAVVYAATHRNKKRFAVKMLHPELSMRQDVRDRFVREGYVANTIEHPNALAVLDDDVTEDGGAFVVMELLQGLTVEELWESRSHKLPPRAVLAIAHGLLDVLAAAHHKSIVHRDIKPANVFVLDDGTVKVLDFGIARLRDAAITSTSTGMILGTPAFLPPEQALAKSNEIDHRTDIWAVGATMFTLLSGMLVHEGDNGAQLVIQTATRPARSLAKAAPEMPPAIVALVDRALAFEQAGRWPTAVAMRDAIESAHLSLFGERLSKAPLAALMGRKPDLAPSDVSMLRTAVAEAPTRASMGEGLVALPPAADVLEATLASGNGLAPDGAAAGATGAMPRIATPRRLGGTTAQPVMSVLGQVKDFELPERHEAPGGPPLRKVGWLLPGAAVGLLLAVAGVSVALKLTSSGPRPAALIAEAPAASAPVASAPVASAPPGASSVVSGVAPAPVGSERDPKLPTAASAAVASASPRARVPASNARPTPAAAPAPAAASAPAAPAPNCNPNYGFDATGKKIWKKECF